MTMGRKRKDLPQGEVKNFTEAFPPGEMSN